MCYYRAKDGKCQKFSDDHVISYCVDGPCPHDTPSNADRIRGMSDEELMKFIDGLQCDYDSSGYIGCQHCSAYGTHHADKSNIGTEYESLYECKDCEFENGLLAWLQQPAKEEV